MCGGGGGGGLDGNKDAPPAHICDDEAIFTRKSRTKYICYYTITYVKDCYFYVGIYIQIFKHECQQ